MASRDVLGQCSLVTSIVRGLEVFVDLYYNISRCGAGFITIRDLQRPDFPIEIISNQQRASGSMVLQSHNVVE